MASSSTKAELRSLRYPASASAGAGSARLVPDTQASTASALCRSALVSGLSESAVADLAAITAVVRLGRREPVFSVGEAGDRLFIVLSGKVKVTRPGDDGKDNVFTIAGPGDLLGELSMFDGAPRRATARAISVAEVACIGNEEMREWLESHPDGSRRFIRIMIDRLRRLNDALDDVYGIDVGTRVARAILRHEQRFGRATGEGTRVDLGLSQEELALHVRASRESVNQVLAEFTRASWVRREGTDLIILDVAALARRAHYRRRRGDEAPDGDIAGPAYT